MLLYSLFLGETIPNPKDIWRKTFPQLAFSNTLAWGQYVVGILLTMLVLVPFFHLDPVAAALIEIAFEGGHGTAAGMADSLSKLNFPEGGDKVFVPVPWKASVNSGCRFSVLHVYLSSGNIEFAGLIDGIQCYFQGRGT